LEEVEKESLNKDETEKMLSNPLIRMAMYKRDENENTQQALLM